MTQAGLEHLPQAGLSAGSRCAAASLAGGAGGLLVEALARVNGVMNAVFGRLFAPLESLPGWLSSTIVAAVAGAVLLVVFKYVSRQSAIGAARNEIQANLLAIKIYRDELGVVLRSQGRALWGALKLLRHSLRPLAIMILPVSLLLAQLGLYYQYRPLRVGEAAVVTVTVRASGDLSALVLEPDPGFEVTAGPVRVPRQKEAHWEIRCRQAGRHTLAFTADGRRFEKGLTVDTQLRRISAMRPARQFGPVLKHPAEPPFDPDSAVQSICVEYPERRSWTSGTDHWMVYFLIVSMVSALLLKPVLKVNF